MDGILARALAFRVGERWNRADTLADRPEALAVALVER
jgi:hypothetical protein